MMFDESGCVAVLVVLAGIGAVGSFGLWAFRLIPAWGIAVGAVGLPVAAVVLLAIFATLNSRR